jgi:hypothetical protein
VSRPSPEAQRELNKRLRAAEAAELDPPAPPPMRVEGEPPSDVPPATARPKRLTVTESDGTVRTVELDPYFGGYLALEHEAPNASQPWITEAVIERFPVFSVESIVLEDVDERS